MTLSTGTGSYSSGGGNVGFKNRRPVSEFDERTPEGVDPEAAWRFSNSTKFRRHGTTAAERSGNVANYTPGYGRSSSRNREQGMTDNESWDKAFHPEKFVTESLQGPTQAGAPLSETVTTYQPGTGTPAAPTVAPITPTQQPAPAPGGKPMFSWDANYPKAQTQQPDRSMSAPTRQVRFNNPKSLIIPQGGNATDEQRFAAEAANLRQNQQMVDPNNNPFKTEVIAPKPEQWQGPSRPTQAGNFTSKYGTASVDFDKRLNRAGRGPSAPIASTRKPIDPLA